MTTETHPPTSRLAQLLNAERDAELDSAGRAELDAILERSSDARARRAQWQTLFNLLDAVPDEEPPRDIARAAVEAASPVRGRAAVSLAGLFSPRRWVPAAAGFAAGLLVTVAAYETIAPTSDFGMDKAVGTARVAQTPAALATASLPGPVVSGELVLRPSPDGFLLEVDVEGASDFTVDVAHAGLRLDGVAFDGQRRESEPAAIRFASGSLAVSGHGRHAFSIRFSSVNASANDGVTVHVTTNNTVVYSGVLGN